MHKVTSADGTTIAYDRLGAGPAVVLVGGGSVDRTANAPLAALLAEHFTVYNYDRRGRGDSGDSGTYAVEREFEDLDAVFAAAGGPAHLYGTSSGAALALLATAAGCPVDRLALREPPYILDGTRPRPPADSARIYREFVAAGRRDDAVEFFLAEAVGLPPEFVTQLKGTPWWPAPLAHTLAYDAEVMADSSLPVDAVGRVLVPVRVLTGGGSWPWIDAGTAALADALPNADRRVLPDQTHDVDTAVMAHALAGFFAPA